MFWGPCNLVPSNIAGGFCHFQSTTQKYMGMVSRFTTQYIFKNRKSEGTSANIDPKKII